MNIPAPSPSALQGAFARLFRASFTTYEATMSQIIKAPLSLFLIPGTAIVASLLAGCSIFAPYDDKFQCERNRDYGKCTDVQGAYTDALGGAPSAEHPVSEPEGKRSKKPEAAESNPARAREDQVIGRAAINRYKAAEYNEMAGLIEQPITPVVAPPKVLRTLVVAYSTSEKTLFLPRYVYYFVSDGNFVVGDYLNAEPTGDASTVYPNGTSPSFR